MASFEHPRTVGTVTEFGVAYEGWRRLQQLSGEAIDLPPGPEAESLQNSTFEACEQAERALLELTPRSDDDAAVLIEVLLGNEEVATLGGGRHCAGSRPVWHPPHPRSAGARLRVNAGLLISQRSGHSDIWTTKTALMIDAAAATRSIGQG